MPSSLRPELRRHKLGSVLDPPGEPGLRMTWTSEGRMERQKDSGSLIMAQNLTLPLSFPVREPILSPGVYVFELVFLLCATR